MQYLRIYATSDGETHFGDVDLPTTNASLFPNEAPFELSGRYPAHECPLSARRRRAEVDVKGT